MMRMLLKEFYPGACADSVEDIDYEKLFEHGYRGLIFDIDNTLVPHGDPSTPQVDAFFRRLHAIGFKTLLLSNNSIARVTGFIENIDTLYICNADKPDPASFHKAVEMLGLPKESVLVIGDQVFTDIRGANRSGLDSILVRFIGHDTTTHYGKRRRVEQLILWFYRHDAGMYNRLDCRYRRNK